VYAGKGNGTDCIDPKESKNACQKSTGFLVNQTKMPDVWRLVNYLPTFIDDHAIDAYGTRINTQVVPHE
jgi:hypothetical protein